jgi:hypothetical protein
MPSSRTDSIFLRVVASVACTGCRESATFTERRYRAFLRRAAATDNI